MSRAFDFVPETRTQAFRRQHGACACCARKLQADHLTRELEVHAHHVTPNQAGRTGNPRDRWLAEPDNCVMLCDDCHHRVHENGHYRDGAVAPASTFPHSHGKDQAAHARWARQHDLRTEAHYAELRQERERQQQRIQAAARRGPRPRVAPGETAPDPGPRPPRRG